MSYRIPNVKLVGYGRSQVYQIVCLKCLKLFFGQEKRDRIDYLFCDECIEDEKLLKEENYSDFPYIGNIKGWIVKMEATMLKRSFYNYKKVLKRDGYICQYCGYSPYYCMEFRPMHIDHIIPFSYIGSNRMSNLVTACSVCNLLVSDKWFPDFFDKKDFILSSLRKKNLKNYIDLKVKYLNRNERIHTGTHIRENQERRERQAGKIKINQTTSLPVY